MVGSSFTLNAERRGENRTAAAAYLCTVVRDFTVGFSEWPELLKLPHRRSSCTNNKLQIGLQYVQLPNMLPGTAVLPAVNIYRYFQLLRLSVHLLFVYQVPGCNNSFESPTQRRKLLPGTWYLWYNYRVGNPLQ